jgi:6-phosphogluconolactonase
MLNEKYRAHIHPDITATVRAAAQAWVALAAQAIAARGDFHVALSGGATPRALYQCLASAEFAGACDWQRIHIWFGDERTVPPQHPDSNYHMAHEALLRHVPVPLAHIHRMQGEQADAHQAARAYQAQMVAHMPLSGAPNTPAIPQFDLILLGLGPDGHVASLFPDTPILTERARWVAAVFVEKLNAWRISLTLPVMENAQHIMMLVTGAGKAGIVGEILGGTAGRLSATPAKNVACYPVQMINPRVAMDWYLDTAAAQYIVGPALSSALPSVIPPVIKDRP